MYWVFICIYSLLANFIYLSLEVTAYKVFCTQDFTIHIILKNGKRFTVYLKIKMLRGAIQIKAHDAKFYIRQDLREIYKMDNYSILSEHK